ncbi:MAG: hypothetical protein R3E01_04210 [Pirellulaceae bacterium]
MSSELQKEQKPSAMQRLSDGMGQFGNHVMQYAKEVATGQKLIQGLSQKDGALDGWLSHGANELATVLLTGHPAPVYTRSLSPADQDQSTDLGAEPPQEPLLQQPASDIGSHAEAREATHQEVTVNRDAGEDMQQTLFQSSLSNLVDRVRSLSPSREPFREMKL